MGQMTLKWNDEKEPRIAKFYNDIKTDGENANEVIKSIVRRYLVNQELEKRME